MERVLARNRELENEIEQLRSQINAQTTAPGSATSIPQDIPEELLIPQKVELDWMPRTTSTWPQASLPSHMPTMRAEAPVSSSYTNDTPIYPTAPVSTNGYGSDETETGQQIYTQAPQAIPIWDDPMVFGPQTSQCHTLSKAAPAWTPFRKSSLDILWTFN